MKIYTIMYNEEFAEYCCAGFESRLDEIYCENYTSLADAKDRLKELFQEAKNQEIFNKVDFDKLREDEDYAEEYEITYSDDIDKNGICYITDNNISEYLFIAKIVENELK